MLSRIAFDSIAFGWVAAAAIACAPNDGTSELEPGDSGEGGADETSGSGGLGEGAGFMGAGGGSGGSTPTCGAPPTPAGPEIVMAPEYAPHYTAYELGPVPGVPDPLGGCTILHSDEDTLLIAGGSERSTGAIYSIGVEREPCGHIIGFVGTAQLVATTPYVDANLVYGPNDLMFYTGWPVAEMHQLPVGASTPAVTTDLTALGINLDSGPGGVGFVPPPLAGAGGLRVVSWPGGHWYHVNLAQNGSLFDVTTTTHATTLPNNPGGFAYVPEGSAGFDVQSIIVAEWNLGGSTMDRVSTYEVDADGDPKPSSRKEFFTSFPRPWGAYFEPVTGDYIFLTWGASPPDRVFIVQGFEPPPPPPTPPM